MNAAKIALVVLVALVVQVCLLARFSYDGGRADVVILVAIAAGFVGGADKGAVVGFAAGVSFDVLLSTPLGLSALVYTIIGYAVGRASAGVLRSAWWIPSVVAAIASVVGVLGYSVVGTVLGEATLDGPPLSAILVVVAAVNAVLAPAAVGALNWTRSSARGRADPRFAR